MIAVERVMPMCDRYDVLRLWANSEKGVYGRPERDAGVKMGLIEDKILVCGLLNPWGREVRVW